MQNDSMKRQQVAVSTEYTSKSRVGSFSKRSVPAIAGRPLAGTQATAETPGKCSGNIKTPVAARTLSSTATARQGLKEKKGRRQKKGTSAAAGTPVIDRTDATEGTPTTEGRSNNRDIRNIRHYFQQQRPKRCRNMNSHL